MKTRVLFICVHNSGRSQMAEAFLKAKAGNRFDVESAGQTPTQVHPLVIQAMQEKGIDLSEKGTQSVFDLYREGKLYDFVITVCRETIEAQCPVFPGIVRREKWEFDDPEGAPGSHEEQLEYVRRIRDDIEAKIDSWLEEQQDQTGQ